MKKSEFRRIIREEIQKIGESKLKESFEKIYDKLDEIDYWKLNDLLALKKKELNVAQKRGDKNALKYTEKDVEDFVRKNNKDAVETMYRQLARNIETNNKGWLKSHLRYNQPFMKDAFEDITGTKLPKTTRDIHKFIDAMDEG